MGTQSTGYADSSWIDGPFLSQPGNHGPSTLGSPQAQEDLLVLQQSELSKMMTFTNRPKEDRKTFWANFKCKT